MMQQSRKWLQLAKILKYELVPVGIITSDKYLEVIYHTLGSSLVCACF